MPSLRPLLASPTCISPASVYDPLSARAAHRLGFEMMLLAGSIASAVVLGAPDIVVLTLTELAEQARRITRVSPLPLLVDADHGYGNALSAIRCVHELESAGVAALTIEDTRLPRPFAATTEQIVPLEEAAAKIAAAVAARTNPETVIVARTSALRSEGVDACARRIAAYTAAGADALFLTGVRSFDDLRTLRAVTSLLFVLGTAPIEMLDRPALAALGVRIVLTGHAPFQAAVHAMYETLAATRDRAIPADQHHTLASHELLADLLDQTGYDRDADRYLQPGSDAG